MIIFANKSYEIEYSTFRIVHENSFRCLLLWWKNNMLLKKRKKYIEILSQHYSADPPFDLSFQQNLIAPPGLCSECHRWINTFCPWMVHTGTKEAGICSPWEGRLTRLGDGTLKARTSERSCFLVLLLLSREHFKIWWKSRGENKIFNNIIGIFL